MFVHLHTHSEYSLLNGACRVGDLVAKAKELGMPALALTDYGNIFGAVEFFTACDKKGVKPILGCEFFIPSYDDHTLKQYKRGQDLYFQVVLLVQNETGYKNLSQLITKASIDGFYYKPRVDTKLLKEFSEGLIAISSGFNSEINHHLMLDDEPRAREALKKYAAIFPERFYVEIENNGLEMQPGLIKKLAKLAREENIPLVATGNVHYIKRDDAEAFEVLRGIQLSRATTSPNDHVKFTTDGYYFKTEDEMLSDFADYPEAIENTLAIAEKCNFKFQFGKYHLPQYQTPVGLTLDDYIKTLSLEGLKKRWDLLTKVSGVTLDDYARYEERLIYELGVISKMGFSGYFLIVSDFIRWAKEHGIPVGPGRGSGAGSLVAYCLDITDLDPLPYNLLFERFLNPERISMPDFDIDFCQDRRGEVIDYVSKKYGNVSQIITFGKMKAKAVIRDVGRVMGLEYDFVDKIAKLVPNELGITLDKALETEPDLKNSYDDDPVVTRLINTSLKLEGLSRHASVHAAGVIITDRPLWEFVPLYKGGEDVVVQFDMKSAEKIGLIKFDFLGLKTLTVIHKAIENIRVTTGTVIDINLIPLADELVFESLSAGDSCGIFQLESSGMRDLMTRLKPTLLEDIIALVALYRPGPMDLIPDFIERKHGRQTVDYLDSRLETVLGPTYGIMVYQEQVMQIAQILGGYTLGGADLLRRAMGKKDVNEMAKQRSIFEEGALKNGLTKELADQIFALMEKFAGYGFNKSHAAAYALVSYQTAWLKAHHVTEYMAALMSTELEDTDKVLIFMNDCKKHGVTMLTPNINVSVRDFTVEGDKKIRYGLGALKGVGAAAIESIIEARTNGGAFKSLYDFCLRVDLRRVTKKVVEVLIKSGAFDFLKLPRKGLFDGMENIMGAAAKTQRDRESGQNDLFASFDTDQVSPVGLEIKTEEDWSQNEKLLFEKEVFGLYFSGHPLQIYADNIEKLTTHTILDLKQLAKESEVTLGGMVLSNRVILTKSGEKMAFAVFEDLVGQVEIIVFSRTYKKYGEILASEKPLILKGKVDRGDEGDKIIVESIELVSDKLKLTTRSIHLDIPFKDFTESKLKRVLAIFNDFSGASPVYIHLKKELSYEAVLELPLAFRAMACEGFMHKMNQLFDGKVVRFN